MLKFTAGTIDGGTVIFDQTSNGTLAVATKADGNLVVAGDYEVKEITNTGNLVKQFQPAEGAPGFVNIRGLAFDSSTNSLYVSMLGYSGHDFQVEKFDDATGSLLASATFLYADSLYLTADGGLLVGSRTQAPALFDLDLNLVRQLDGDPQLFVTQDPPEA